MDSVIDDVGKNKLSLRLLQARMRRCGRSLSRLIATLRFHKLLPPLAETSVDEEEHAPLHSHHSHSHSHHSHSDAHSHSSHKPNKPVPTQYPRLFASIFYSGYSFALYHTLFTAQPSSALGTCSLLSSLCATLSLSVVWMQPWCWLRCPLCRSSRSRALV
jgi:hypothetical protein